MDIICNFIKIKFISVIKYKHKLNHFFNSEKLSSIITDQSVITIIILFFEIAETYMVRYLSKTY